MNKLNNAKQIPLNIWAAFYAKMARMHQQICKVTKVSRKLQIFLPNCRCIESFNSPKNVNTKLYYAVFE